MYAFCACRPVKEKYNGSKKESGKEKDSEESGKEDRKEEDIKETIVSLHKTPASRGFCVFACPLSFSIFYAILSI